MNPKKMIESERWLKWLPESWVQRLIDLIYPDTTDKDPKLEQGPEPVEECLSQPPETSSEPVSAEALKPLTAAQIEKDYKGQLVIGSSRDRILVTIGKDGTLTYGAGYTPDESAKLLWDAIARKRADHETRQRYLELLEMHMALLSVADQAYEIAQTIAKTEGASEYQKFQEEMSRRNLETRFHGVLEFAREFAHHRPDLIAAARSNIPGGHGGDKEQN